MPKVSSDTPGALDKRMWRLLKARCHPDQGGSHELFIWLDAIIEVLQGINGSRPTPTPPKEEDDEDRLGKYRACHRKLFQLLINTGNDGLGPWDDPATPKQIKYIAVLAKMSKGDSLAFYESCRDFGISKHAASWLIERLLG